MSIALAVAASLLAQHPTIVTDPDECLRNPADSTSLAQHQVFCFVSWLYGPGQLETITPLGADAPRVFTAAARADMAAARRRGGEGGHPAFQADPICDCQDPTDLRILSSAVPEVSENRAVAVVHFDFGKGIEISPEESRRVHTLHLKREDGGWRIDDVTNAAGWSFRASLRD